MNTEREALQLAWHEWQVNNKSVTSNWTVEDLTEYYGLFAFSYGKGLQAALANKPEANDPVAYRVGNWYETQSGNLVQVVSYKSHCMECSDGLYRYNNEGDKGRVTGSPHDYSHPENFVRLYTAPPSTAALQKRIEELEAVLDKKDEALDKAAQIAQDESRMLRKHFKAKYGNISSSELIRALKAGDVQAPKEGWHPIETAPENGEFLAFGNYMYPDDNHPTEYIRVAYRNTKSEEYPFGDEEGLHPPGFFSHWMPLPAAPTDTEGE